MAVDLLTSHSKNTPVSSAHANVLSQADRWLLRIQPPHLTLSRLVKMLGGVLLRRISTLPTRLPKIGSPPTVISPFRLLMREDLKIWSLYRKDDAMIPPQTEPKSREFLPLEWSENISPHQGQVCSTISTG